MMKVNKSEYSKARKVYEQKVRGYDKPFQIEVVDLFERNIPREVSVRIKIYDMKVPFELQELQIYPSSDEVGYNITGKLFFTIEKFPAIRKAMKPLYKIWEIFKRNKGKIIDMENTENIR